jgi:alkylresorcinol/alkylpyrone synthase
MTRLIAVAPVLPEHRYSQADITDAFLSVCLDGGSTFEALVRRLHTSAQVEFRHLAFPLDHYAKLDTFAAANDAFLDAATSLGATAVSGALDAAGLTPRDVDVIVSTTVTGIAVPSLEARIAAVLGMPEDVRRIPLFGLGCAGGAAGVARLDDHLRAHPEQVGVLVSVELCSLTTQRGHTAVPHLVASALFGDGAAAVVAVGDRHPLHATAPGPVVTDTASVMYADSERAMGWDVGEWGLRIVLDADVPGLVESHLGGDVSGFLARHQLDPAAIDPWICHPGGPKVLQAVESALSLTDGELAVTWASLRAIGNLSSASVLHVLADTWQQRPPDGGRHAVLMAMGPGFASELVLLDW